MATGGNSDIKYHISTAERARWNECVTDFEKHLKAGGTDNHPLGNGTLPGFSTNDFTNELKNKLDGIEEGALNNPHPTTHPASMITGLANIAISGSWSDLGDIPQRVIDVINGVADAATVGGIRVTINAAAPANPQNDKEIWIDTTALVLKIYHEDSWQIIGAAWR